MKKLLSAMLLIFVLSQASFGAVSQDMSVYVRQDVFDAKMEIVNSKLDRLLEEMKVQREELQLRGKEINTLAQSVAVLSERVDRNYMSLDTRIADLRNGLYLGLVLFAAVLMLPFFNKWWEVREERKEKKEKPVTIDEVKQLIANAIAEAQFSSRI